MQLTKADYDSLLPYKDIIKHVSFGGNTNKGDAWWAMNTVNINRLGQALTGSGCSACMVEQYQRYWNYIEEYEAQLFNLTNNN